MKKLLIMSIMLVATIAFATAQQGQGQRQNRTPEEQAKATTDRMVELLKLNADQKTKVEAIELDLAKQQAAKMQNIQGNREAMTAVRQEMDKLREAKYKPVLTDAQFKTYLDNRTQRGQGQGQGGQRGQGQGQGPR